MGASAKTRLNSNSAIAKPNISKVMGPPACTEGKILANRFLYSGTLLIRLNTSARMAKLSPGKLKPATSTRSVGGMKAWASSRCGKCESVVPSGGGNKKPALLSNGSFESEAKREFHIRFG